MSTGGTPTLPQNITDALNACLTDLGGLQTAQANVASTAAALTAAQSAATAATAAQSAAQAQLATDLAALESAETAFFGTPSVAPALKSHAAGARSIDLGNVWKILLPILIQILQNLPATAAAAKKAK